MYGISGIGLDPTLGLGGGGAYSTYDTYMNGLNGYGMMNGMNMMNGMGMMGNMGAMNGMSMMGGMGMYNPSFMAQMQQLQNQMEANNLIHAGNMHTLLTNNAVQAQRDSDSALIQKILTNGDCNQGIQNLYAKVKEGDQDGVCHEFDKLKTYIQDTYRDEINARGDKINPAVSATQIIEALYSNIISTQTGTTHDLRSDIEEYGDGTVRNGFMKGFRRGHHDRDIDHTKNHCFGLEIDQKETKDSANKAAQYVGRTASVAEKGVYGAVTGAAGWGLLTGIGTLVGSLIGHGKDCFKGMCKGKAFGLAALVGAVGGMVLDTVWQNS